MGFYGTRAKHGVSSMFFDAGALRAVDDDAASLLLSFVRQVTAPLCAIEHCLVWPRTARGIDYYVRVGNGAHQALYCTPFDDIEN